jgi:hypothetical protein
MIISGTGFRQEDTVWIGSHRIQVASNDGENLQFLVSLDISPGTYKVYVENIYGKTNETEVSVRAAQALRISNIQTGERIHPGQQILLAGSGFLLENKVWFGTQAVAAKLILSGGAMLQVSVPASITAGPSEIYVSNASGKGDVVDAYLSESSIWFPSGGPSTDETRVDRRRREIAILHRHGRGRAGSRVRVRCA